MSAFLVQSAELRFKSPVLYEVSLYIVIKQHLSQFEWLSEVLFGLTKP